MSNEQELMRLVSQNRSLQAIFGRVGSLGMPNWYLGAGAIAQTVWNLRHGFHPEYGIQDYDIVYFDGNDISYEGEDGYIRRGAEMFEDIPVPVQIRNQARVHLWYEAHFGKRLEPYASVEAAIRTWPTTATAVGIRIEDGQARVFAPFGLDDTLDMIVRPNAVLVTQEIYRQKVERWMKVWPDLHVVPWGALGTDPA